MHTPQIDARRIDLTEAHDLGAGTEVRVTIDSKVFWVARLDAPAEIRVERHQDATPLVERPYWLQQGDSWGEIVLENEASSVSGAEAVLVWGSGFLLGDGGGTGRQVVDSISPRRVVVTDHSGQLAAASTSEQVMPANDQRQYLLVQNTSGAVLWIELGGAAVEDQPSIRLQPDMSYEAEGLVVPTEEVQVIGPNAGQSYTAKEA